MAKINQLPPLAPVREVVLITEEVAELIGVSGEGADSGDDTSADSGTPSGPTGADSGAQSGTGADSGTPSGPTGTAPEDEEQGA